MSAVSDRTRLGLEILGVGVVAGVLGDALLRAPPWGLNAFVCTAALVAGGWWLVRRHRVAVTRDALWLAGAALLVASNFVARDAPMLRAFDVVGLVILLALASLSLKGVALGGRQAWHYAHAGIASALAAWLGIFPLVGSDVTWSELPGEGRMRQVRGAALGAMLAFPLLLVFGGLFTSADAVFRGVVSNAIAIDFGDLLSHVVLFALWGALVAGYFRGALIRSLLPEGGGESRVALGIVPAATALGLVNLLFLVFVIVQLRYLFGGAALVATTGGLTYAEYARQGFFQLVTASALVLPLLSGADWLLRNEPLEHQRTFRHLATVLLLLLAVVMASALERMRLYVAAFGLSEIRLYSTAFMLYLAGVAAWFGWTALRGQRRRFAFGALVQGFVVLGGLHLINPDAFIVRANLARPAAVRPFDGLYAASLGADAVPALLDALPRLAPPEQCRVAGRLLRERTRLGDGDWRTWNLARVRARRLLNEQQGQLRALACAPPARS